MDIWGSLLGNPLVLLLCLLVVTLGAVVQGVLGFGLALLSVPVLAWIAPEFVPVGVLVAVVPLVLVTALRERSHVDLRGIGWALVGRLPGGAVGALAVAWLPVRGLQLLIAATVCLAVVAAVVTDIRGTAARRAEAGREPADAAGTGDDGTDQLIPSRGPRRVVLALAGALSGVGGTTSGIGGPPMAIAFRNSGGPAIRSTLASFFLLGSVLSIGSLALVGEVTLDQLAVGLLLVPAVVLGYLLSGPLRRRVSTEALRRAVLVLSGAAGTGLLLSALTGG